MSAEISNYRRVPGGGFSWRGRGSLWLAEDHLLEVSSILFMEQYRRFFFRDVRAFVLQRTNLRLVWGWIYGGVGAVFALIAGVCLWAALGNASAEWQPLLYVPVGLCGPAALVLFVMLVINLSLGPTCQCHVLTATGWQALSAPKRLGRATRAQAEIIAIIEGVQGPAPAPGVAAAATS